VRELYGTGQRSMRLLCFQAFSVPRMKSWSTMSNVHVRSQEPHVLWRLRCSCPVQHEARCLRRTRFLWPVDLLSCEPGFSSRARRVETPPTFVSTFYVKILIREENHGYQVNMKYGSCPFIFLYYFLLLFHSKKVGSELILFQVKLKNAPTSITSISLVKPTMKSDSIGYLFASIFYVNLIKIREI
jgi:hypothetical protein